MASPCILMVGRYRAPFLTLLCALVLLIFSGQAGSAASLRLLLESDADGPAGNEVFITSFATFDDLVNSPPSGGAGAFSGINIAPGFSVGGFAYDGIYHLLLESDADGPAGNEVFITSFATFDDLLNSPPSGGVGAFSGINIAPGFSVGGFAYDGIYHLLLESDADGPAGNEVFITSFATFDDLVNSPPSGGAGAFSGINIAPGFSVGGFAYEFDPDSGLSPVPAPASLPLLAGGFAMLAIIARRSRKSY